MEVNEMSVNISNQKITCARSTELITIPVIKI